MATAGANAWDEWDFTTVLGSGAVAALQTHYSSWITEADFEIMYQNGMNHVRIPTGFVSKFVFSSLSMIQMADLFPTLCSGPYVQFPFVSVGFERHIRHFLICIFSLQFFLHSGSPLSLEVSFDLLCAPDIAEP